MKKFFAKNRLVFGLIVVLVLATFVPLTRFLSDTFGGYDNISTGEGIAIFLIEAAVFAGIAVGLSFLNNKIKDSIEEEE